MGDLKIVQDEQWPTEPCLTISRSKGGVITVDQGVVPTDEAKAMLASAFVAFCAPPSVVDER